MKTRPDSKDLLEAARKHLLEILLPQLKGEAHKDALMVADAMAIAIRDFSCRETLPIKAKALEVLYPGQNQWTSEVIEAFRRDVKNGRFDQFGPERQAAEQALKTYADAELNITNPKYHDTASYD